MKPTHAFLKISLGDCSSSKRSNFYSVLEEQGWEESKNLPATFSRPLGINENEDSVVRYTEFQLASANFRSGVSHKHAEVSIGTTPVKIPVRPSGLLVKALGGKIPLAHAYAQMTSSMISSSAAGLG